jgi:hypothetical protein
MLTTLLTDNRVLYDNMVRTAHHDLSFAGSSTQETNEFSPDSDIDDDDDGIANDDHRTTASDVDGDGKEVNVPFNNPFANVLLMPLIQSTLELSFMKRIQPLPIASMVPFHMPIS